MTDLPVIPLLTPDWEPTRLALHAYARVLRAVALEHNPPHPHWWHISLEVTPGGLSTDPMPLADGREAALTLDVLGGDLVVAVTDGSGSRLSIAATPSVADLAPALSAALTPLGLAAPLDELADVAVGEYSSEHAAAFWEQLVVVDGLFRRHRATLDGDTGPVQVWPHGFDMSFEWFGDRAVPAEGGTARSQLNLGFYPAGDAYFYSSPWPFEEALAATVLPDGARWNTEGWTGAMLPLTAVGESRDGAQRVLDFAAAVFRVSRPTLVAEGG